MKILKLPTLLLLLIVSSVKLLAQNSIPRHQLRFGYFRTSSTADKALLILTPSYEYRLPFLKDHLSLGLSYIYVKDLFNSRNETSYVSRVNYHLVNNKTFDLFGGIGVAYAMRTSILNNLSSTYADESNVRLTYQYGFRIFPLKNVGFSLELSNYKYSSGVFPTIGVNGRF
jgi:hypothetical protein